MTLRARRMDRHEDDATTMAIKPLRPLGPLRVLQAWVLGGLLAVATCHAQPARKTYLFELLDQPAYAQAWKQLLRSSGPTEPWLDRYLQTRNGPTTAAQEVRVDEVTYSVYMVCKTHDCGDHRLYVVFAPDGHEAWGLLRTHATTQRWLGNPNTLTQQALQKASQP